MRCSVLKDFNDAKNIESIIVSLSCSPRYLKRHWQYESGSCWCRCKECCLQEIESDLIRKTEENRVKRAGKYNHVQLFTLPEANQKLLDWLARPEKEKTDKKIWRLKRKCGLINFAKLTLWTAWVTAKALWEWNILWSTKLSTSSNTWKKESMQNRTRIDEPIELWVIALLWWKYCRKSMKLQILMEKPDFNKSDVELWNIWRGKDHKTKEHDFLVIPVQKLSKSV